jgi:hypothetical protein
MLGCGEHAGGCVCRRRRGWMWLRESEEVDRNRPTDTNQESLTKKKKKTHTAVHIQEKRITSDEVEWKRNGGQRQHCGVLRPGKRTVPPPRERPNISYHAASDRAQETEEKEEKEKE